MVLLFCSNSSIYAIVKLSTSLSKTTYTNVDGCDLTLDSATNIAIIKSKTAGANIAINIVSTEALNIL